MSKSRAVRPAGLAGSGRKLVSALSGGSTSIEDNECMKASKDICLGLACFHATFGFDDANQESFHGFSPHEIRLASDTARIRRHQVANEHKARGFVYTPSTLFPPVLKQTPSTSSASEPPAELSASSDVDANLPNGAVNEVVKKSSVLKKVKKSVAGSVCGSDDMSRSLARKFVLPVRSAHSSRIIKPNKRFRDPEEEEWSGDGSEASSSKKMRFDSFSDDSSSSSWLTKKDGGGGSDFESAGGWSSSVSTASSSVKDEDISSSLPAKVILRKAKLKVESSLPPVPGTFSSEGGSEGQRVVCGVCGAVRFYKYVMQARKFGICSCESCRKFISRVIAKAGTHTKLSCRTGNYDCIIPPYMKDPITGEKVTHSRCRACWLKICLHCYCMPPELHRKLKRLLPNTGSSDQEDQVTETKRKLQLKETSRKYLKLSSTKLNYRLMEQQIQLAKSLRKKAEARLKTMTAQAQVSQVTVKSEEEPQERVKRKYVRKAISNGAVGKRSRKDMSVEEKTQKLKGPRVKHVCRSASLVLGQPVATFTDTSPSKQAANTTGENSNISQSNLTSELDGSDVSLKKDLGSKPKLSCGEAEVQTVGKMKCKPAPLPGVEHNTDALLDGKARTLQDLTRQHYELMNGATLEEEHTGLIHIDFWESYDPDTVNKSGFALVGYHNSFNSKPVCFVCGCSGNDKVIHCACCCEPFHHYCVEGMGAGVVEGGADWWLVDWVCSRCTLCRTCGKGGGNQVSCQRCRKSFHTECLTADRVASKLHSADRPWVCQSCLCCKSCNKAEVYKFVGNLPLCRNCFKLRQRGNFCPLCQSCYNDNDFDTKMMECERCKCWVHAKCEGLSNEKYHILSILPDSVEFVCRLCCKEPPAPWWVAVETEIKAGFLAVIKSLSKNRKACDLLKWSPSKRPSGCLCSTRRCPDLSEQSDAESADVRLPSKDEAEEECRKRLHSDDETLVYNGTGTGTGSGKLYTDLQLKLDSDAISYPVPDEKPPQFSPHATSQSDSGIGSTDDELKPANEQCYCLETWHKNPQTLLSVKKKVVTNEYSSLESFNKEMEEMISQQGEELMKIYHQTLEDVFPWFDPLCSEVFESATRINIPEIPGEEKSTYGEETPKQREIVDVKTTLKDRLNLDSDYYYNLDKLVDERMCMLCKTLGEGKTSEEGRLLYCGQGDWVHSNCALWSNEVFEEIDGALQNVQSAISRGRHIRCSHCMKKGASVGCCNRTCPEAYHFICARKSHCVFLEDKSLFCETHRKDSRTSRVLDRDEDFLVARPVYVELDSKKKKSVFKQNVNIVIGSLRISSLGDIVPDLSDHEGALVPCNYQCTRMFWSSVEPWRLVQYTIRTKIVYTISDPEVDNEHNFTVDHCPEMDLFPPVKPQYECDENQVREVIENLVESVCAKEDEDPQSSQDLLPPELKDAIFEDLPHDLFDGISMQDIFPKLMNYDCSEPKPNRETKSSNCHNTKKRTNSIDQYSLSPVKSLETKSPKLSLSLKKKSKALSDDVKRVHSNDEKENTRWLSKILQIDGAGDVSSDSSDDMSESAESLTDIVIKNNTKPSNPVQGIHPMLLDESSRSSSECNSDWNLGQVDGTMDFCSVKDNDDLEEDPVKCSQCHRTYRTALSFDRHLQTCSTDYILSCSESDSSEEDKLSNSAETKLTEELTEEADLKTIDEEANFEPEELAANEEENEDFTEVDQELESFDQLNCDTNSIDDNTSNSYHNQTIFEEATDFSSHFSLQSPADMPSFQPDQLPYTCRPKTIRAMIESNETQGFEIPLCGRTSPVTIRPVKTYVRRKKVTTTAATVAPPQQAMVEYQAPSHNSAPTLIIQSMPQNTLQYSPQIPLAIPISIQPVIPTVLIQPTGMEQYVLNAPAQPGNVYITNQPMYQTMVSNTVMSSSQFINGMTYSATTTQVYQTAKPMMQQSYVVVNTPQSTPAQLPQPQTLYTNPPQGQPWTLNYQVKEKTTYEQVTGDNGMKLVNSSQEAFIIQKPVIKKVTVEKTHSFQRSGNCPELVQVPFSRPSQPVLPEVRLSIEEVDTRPSLSFSPEKCLSIEEVKSTPVAMNVSCKLNEDKVVKSKESVTVSFSNNCEEENTPSLPKVVSPVKPIITKIKSKPKVSTEDSNSIHSQPKKVCEVLKPKEQTSAVPVAKVQVKLPNNVTKKPQVQENRPKLGIKSGVELEKIMEKKQRVPLKENKFLQKVKKYKKTLPAYNLCDPKLVYEVSSQDGISICSQDLTEAWKKIFDAVQKARAAKRLPPLPGNPLFSHLRMLGLDNNRVKYLIEQLPGVGSCTKYKPTYHKCKLYGHSEPLRENTSGCARAEPHARARRKYDMFSWLASRHRHPPKLIVNSESEIVNGISRRATSSNLPMAMRFRHLKETSKEAVGVFRSDIHGRGLFCLRDIEAGEMVIEYAGEVIRAGLTDMRENYYTSKGIGCYMFRIDDHSVVDATMRGNAARFINHSCEPNCYSRVVDILGKKHILIFALHKIPKGEELTYDYKFPLEEDKITCHCLSRKCRKYLN